MAGNVWEWTASEPEPGSEVRVLRGGAFDDDTRYVRCTCRSGNYPYFLFRSSGFRVVVAPG
jgi:formylglycine-generating enzyme required for sulfatase activity